ncbi:MAG: O-antigen ligase family protein [Candidatus Pacebacteria bacterium]|nr:O-antigen ligase family protein [Candidatus Paceibacterota bacterium]
MKILPQSKSRPSANSWWQRWSKIGADRWLVSLLSLLIFLIPSNLFLVLHEQSAYANGIRIDYLIPKLYLSALVALSFVILTAAVYKKRLLLLWLALLGISIWYNWFFAELLLAGAVAWSMTQLPKQILQNKQLTWGLVSMIVFQSVVSIAQFFLQKSLFGYKFLGESDLLHFAGIATQTIGGREFILPSGTTAHPNVLAGILVIAGVLLWQRRGDLPRWLALGTLLVGLIALILTISLSAWLAAVLAIAFFLVKNKFDPIQKKLFLIGIWSFAIIIPLTLAQLVQISAHPSLVRRVALNEVAVANFVQNPIWGTGLNTFTKELSLTNTNKDLERFIQPAHNIPLLTLSEIGVVGVLAVLGLLIWLQRKNYHPDSLLLASCIAVPLLSLDHYLYTLESGRLAVAVLLLMVLVKESEKEPDSV